MNKRKLEQAIGHFKYEGEKWGDVFERANKEGGIDHKTLTNVIICILEELDGNQKEKSTYEEPEAVIRTESNPVQQGDDGLTDKVQPTISNTEERQNSSK